MTDQPPATATLQQTLDAWRKRGAQRLDPVRLRLIEALARRAAAHEGPARALLDARLARLMAEFGEALEAAPSTEPAPLSFKPATAAAHPTPRLSDRPRGALGELADLLTRQPQGAARPEAPGTPQAAAPATPRTTGSFSSPAALPELQTLTRFKHTWARLSADRALSHARERVPDQAGPLNSEHLVHQALALMRAVAPGYLDRFMGHVDALSAIDHLLHARLAAPADTPARAPAKPPAKAPATASAKKPRRKAG